MTRNPTYNSQISFEPEPFETISGGRFPRQTLILDGSSPLPNMPAGFSAESTSALLVVYGADPIPTISEVTFVDVETFCDTLIHRTSQALTDLGTPVPSYVIAELINNFIFANFQDVVISISDGGHTISFSDHGPGLTNIEQSLRVGFSSATAFHKRYIRGAGAGFEVVRMHLRDYGGTLSVEENLGGGAVVTLCYPFAAEKTLPLPLVRGQRSPSNIEDSPTTAQTTAVGIFLNERQWEVLNLSSRYPEIGPQLVSDILGIALSTAYRDLTLLENHGLLLTKPNGKRAITKIGQSINITKEPLYDY